MTDDERKLLTEIAKSYNEDLQFETVHRQVMLYNLATVIVWITLTIVDVWGLVKFHEDPIWVTIMGAMLIITSLSSCIGVHLKYKSQAKKILHARTSCLQIRDNTKP